MRNFKMSVISPLKIKKKLLKTIIALCNKTFNFPRKLITQELRKKDLLILYEDQPNNNLIGFIGVKWFEHQNSVSLYVGTVLIDNEYRRHGILSHSQAYAILMTCLKYPLKKKFGVALITTATAFSWVEKFPIYWPKQDQQTPPKMLDLMYKMAGELVGKDHYVQQNGVILTDTLSCALAKQGISDAFKTNTTATNNFFNDINPDAIHGKQMLVLIPINSKNLFIPLKVYLLKKANPIKNKIIHLANHYKKCLLTFGMGIIVFAVYLSQQFTDVFSDLLALAFD